MLEAQCDELGSFDQGSDMIDTSCCVAYEFGEGQNGRRERLGGDCSAAVRGKVTGQSYRSELEPSDWVLSYMRLEV